MNEKIKIQIKLTAEFWDKFPIVDLVLDNNRISHHVIDKKQYVIEDVVELEMDKPHLLQLRRSNKSDDQCIEINNQKQDQYVIIDEVSIDGINVENLIWNRSWFEPQYPVLWAEQQKENGIELETKVIGETWLSHNGVWNFEFFSPFYKFVISQFGT